MTLCLVFFIDSFYFGALIILEKRPIRNCLYECMYHFPKWYDNFEIECMLIFV